MLLFTDALVYLTSTHILLIEDMAKKTVVKLRRLICVFKQNARTPFDLTPYFCSGIVAQKLN